MRFTCKQKTFLYEIVVNEEGTKIYIYDINQKYAFVLKVSSALTICVFWYSALNLIFMVAYIPLRSFASGYHAKTYIFSVMILVIIMLSPVIYKNKPLNKTEHELYKRRVIFITVVEFAIGQLIKLAALNNLFVAVVYSFNILSLMHIIEMIKLV